MEKMFAYNPAERITVWAPPFPPFLPARPDSSPAPAHGHSMQERRALHASCLRATAPSEVVFAWSSPGKLTDCDIVMGLQARDALAHPYFDDLDKEAVDKLENESIRVQEG